MVFLGEPRCHRCTASIASVCSLALAVTLAASAAQAGSSTQPSGGVVAAGSASILQSGPTSTTIVQQSRNAVINWQNFSVGAGTSVAFQQPDSASITLNRVNGSAASVLNGSLLANGQIWLINQNGILFGQGSRVDVGGLIATTSDIKDSDFLSGNYLFGVPSANPDAAVVNLGSISTAPGGSAILSASRVSNEGVIQANLGHVVLGGADAFSVSFDGDTLIQYQITIAVSQAPKDADGKPAAAIVSNAGLVSAPGGKVLMTARAASGIVDNVINSTGIIQAQSASIQNGEVVLDAGDGSVNVSGTVDVSGQKTGETGGTVTLTGQQVTVADGAQITASGNAGGGTISIGGNSNTAGPQPNAQSVTVAKAMLSADATASGNGGTITIVSNGQASIAASISAKGVAAGGRVETSGSDLNVTADAHVDTSASAGTGGLWLLDPLNVDINPALAANIVGNLANTNVTLSASNDINVNAPVVYASANALTLLAGHNLTVNATVRNDGTGNILAVAGWDGVTSASNILTTPGAYGGKGGSILISGGVATGGVVLASEYGATTVAAQDLTISALNGYAQLGYHSESSSIVASGAITVELSGQLTLIGGNAVGDSFAQIGHGAPVARGNLSGNISISAEGPINLMGGSAPDSYAQIGNGGAQNTGNISGNVFITSGGDINLSNASSISASGVGDALVIAAMGNFTNQAGSNALGVSGGGRWLVFLSSPADNQAGGLDASPFYNRAFDFSTDGYSPVTGAGDRFVYALAPVLTVTVTNATKTYGTANPAFTATITGALPGDAISGVFSGAPSFNTAATAGSNVGNYPIVGSLGTLSSDFNYGFQLVNGTLHIAPATLTAQLTGSVRKIYDGTTSASLTAANYQLSGVLAGDNVSLNDPANGSYSDKNVGSSKVVSAGGLVLSGPSSGNYVLSSTIASGAIGTITPLTIAASLTGNVQKIYDGTTAATLAAANYQLSGVLAGDSVTLNNPANGTYSDKNVGSFKVVSAGGLALSGPDGGNYVLSSTNVSGAVGTITPLTIVASLTGSTQKIYDGTTSASLTAANYQLSGVLAGDSVILNSPANGSYSDKNVGSFKIVSAGGLTLSGPSNGNYQLSSTTASGAIGTITPLTVVASLTGSVEKIFDGTTSAILIPANYTLSGTIATDNVSLNDPAAGSYDTQYVGSGKTVSVGGLTLVGPDGGNYILASSDISGVIGIISASLITDAIGNSYTSAGASGSPAGAAPPAGGSGPAPASDATSDTGVAAADPSDSAAFQVGKSLSGVVSAAQSSSSVVLGGLLRQFSAPPGATNPRGVPPYGQVYSSWGNEAFWQ